MPAAHTRPQDPQLVALVLTLVSHPSAALPLQSANPGLQAPIRQTPLTQAPIPFGVVQTAPHAPQLFGLVKVDTHTLLHSVWPEGHEVIQTPF